MAGKLIRFIREKVSISIYHIHETDHKSISTTLQLLLNKVSEYCCWFHCTDAPMHLRKCFLVFLLLLKTFPQTKQISNDDGDGIQSEKLNRLQWFWKVISCVETCFAYAHILFIWKYYKIFLAKCTIIYET